MPDEAPTPPTPPSPPSPPSQPETPAPAQPPASGQAAVAERPKTSPPKTDHLPPYKVLLHNDDVNDIVWVVRSVVELTSHPPKKAMLLVEEAHTTGISLLLVTHQERAELYQEQFQSKGLTVTIEPAE